MSKEAIVFVVNSILLILNIYCATCHYIDKKYFFGSIHVAAVIINIMGVARYMFDI